MLPASSHGNGPAAWHCWGIGMDADVLRLEKLRQQAQAGEDMSGNLVDYLNHGGPNDQEARETWQRIEECDKWHRDGLTELAQLLATLRRDNPAAVKRWVHWHMEICRRILREPEQPKHDADGLITDYAVRQGVARDTLREWQRVLSGKQDYVMINYAWLGDYDEEISAAVKQAESIK